MLFHSDCTLRMSQASFPAYSQGDDDDATATTPLASQMPSCSPPDAPVSDSTPSRTLLSPSQDPIGSRFMLPITNPPAKPSFTVSDVYGADESSEGFGQLAPEIASADISIAADGSFVETSSAAAAMELKRRYDHLFGVNKDVRSPYAITSFVNQHGRQKFRVGRKELSAPMASAVEAENRTSQQLSSGLESPPFPRSSKRSSRLSVHQFLRNGSVSIAPKVDATSGRSPPSRAVPRKLVRKTRSIPDLYSGLGEGLSKADGAGPSNGHPSGRTHSHSVTAADLPRLPPSIAPPKPPTGDVFNEVMGWDYAYSTPSSPFGSNVFSVSVHSLRLPSEADAARAEQEPRPLIFHPFGPGISFDSPSRKTSTPSTRMSSPHGLRVMQSFESGLTARADANTHILKGGPPKLTLNFEPEPEGSALLPIPSPSHSPTPSPPPPPRQPTPVTETAKSAAVDPTLLPLWETSQYSRYSTDVFDVLQTYRGLPLLDKIDPFSEVNETTIKLTSDETAAPRDDPRFVIWGEVVPSAAVDPELQSMSPGSRTDTSSQQSVMSRKLSMKSRTSFHNGHDTPPLHVATEGRQKVLVAATIERWIAQLTSELNYDELLNFFLTYRTYVSPVDLAQLLICRFHWALGPASSAHDDMVRRIVRVRTFVALRYWLLTFFPVDFLPNRDLRLLFAGWLNTLRRDPILGRHQGALSIVRKLRQVVKECKEAHTRRQKEQPLRRPSVSSTAKQFPKAGQSLGDLSDGRKFAESLRKAVAEGDDESDVDLDFGVDEGVIVSLPQGFPSQKDVSGSGSGQPSGQNAGSPPSVPSASLAVLQQPLQLTILQHANATATDSPFVETPATLPVHHSTLSRVLVKTIGRLGRWKRVLNQRSSALVSSSTSADVSAFDLELNMSGDLLNVPGGVEQYLKMIEQPEPDSSVNGQNGTALPDGNSSSLGVQESADQTDSSSMLAPRSSVDSAMSSDTYSTSMSEETDYGVPISHLRSVTEASDECVQESPGEPVQGDLEQLEPRAESVSSNPRRSFESYTSYNSRRTTGSRYRRQQKPWQPPIDVVSIDDLEFSDMSSSDENEGPSAPPGLRRVPRRLPLRRDFEFVRRSGSVSSLGIRSHSSMASERSSVASSASVEPALGGPGLQQWQVNAIVDSLSDDDEEGDVEAALRRLEGQINIDEQRMKLSKVDGWVQTMRDRLLNGDYHDEPSRFPTSDSESDESVGDYEGSRSRAGSAVWSPDNADFSASNSSVSQVSERSQDVLEPASQSLEGEAVTPLATQTSHNVSDSPNATSPVSSSDGRPAPEDVVPREILQSRLPSRPSTSGGSREPASDGFPISSPTNKFITAPASQVHRSFILGYRAETLAQHFSMIDRELFLAIKFEEIVSDDWMGCPKEADVLDWSQFLRDRARWKAESRGGPKTSAVVAARGRFNLLSKFVISEVILTHPQHRHLVVGKFIRIAWKSYNMNNFNTLTAIIAGLRSEWVTKAMRRSWGRVGVWEQRMFQDLKAFTSRDDDFKHIRHAVSSMVETKPVATSSLDVSTNGLTDGHSSSSRSRATSDTKPHSPAACIPFLGVYLAQMQRYHKLPDLIDPTAPTEAIGIDPISGNLEAPAHPEVFSSLAPLPASMQLEPLINVQKQRLIAGVIKSLVAGQHLASRVQFPVDRKIFQRCLKLRGLDTETLQRAYTMFSD